jgi:hypothetical protein
MQLDLTYDRSEDRMLLSFRGKFDWYLTRSLLNRLVIVWIDKLERTNLPDIGLPLGQRDIATEHALSIEYDAPYQVKQASVKDSTALLIEEVTITVDALGTRLIIKGGKHKMTLKLTRKESHMVLELLAQKASSARWLDAVQWPGWLIRKE